MTPVIPAALLTLFYLPVHLLLGVKVSEGFKHPVSQFVAVATGPMLLPVVLLTGSRPFGANRAGLPGPDCG